MSYHVKLSGGQFYVLEERLHAAPRTVAVCAEQSDALLIAAALTVLMSQEAPHG